MVLKAQPRRGPRRVNEVRNPAPVQRARQALRDGKEHIDPLVLGHRGPAVCAEPHPLRVSVEVELHAVHPGHLSERIQDKQE
jgi:hypothetical protein